MAPSSIRKLQLTFTDRLGIVADIASILSEFFVNIRSMEVDAPPGADQVDIFLEVDSSSSLHDWDDILSNLQEIHSLTACKLISTLPRETREKRLQVVLDSISDGILAVDNSSRLTIMNRVAEEITGLSAEKGVGRPLRELSLPENHLSEGLQGGHFDRVPRNIQTGGRRYQFLATTLPIQDSEGRTVGAVEILKDLKRIRQLASAVIQPGKKTFTHIVGSSPALHQPIRLAQQVARTDTLISLRGESGTGKELFAQAIHTESGRKGEFVAINCAAIPENLLESELFGYESGTFTGADRKGKKGLFEQAGEGTLFLDEIAELPPGPQAKLLRVLQEGTIRRVGGDHEITVHCRLLTATSRNLEQMMNRGQFREDLFYRINILPIHIPPLRDRMDDLPTLVDHFLFRFNSRLKKPEQELTPEAFEKLKHHHWPGNIRELKNVIERAAILSSSSRIGPDAILFSFELGRAGRRMDQNVGHVLSRQRLPQLVGDYEKRLLREALERKQGIRETARQLGISHTALLNKIKKYGL